MECYHNYLHRAARPIEDNLHKARGVTEESSDNYGHNHANVSTGTIAKRFKSINVENLEKNRLNFRQTLFSSSAMKDYIGGVILFDETIRQKTTLGPTIPELISKHGAIPGIKVDKGAKVLAGSIEETITEGLDGLRENRTPKKKEKIKMQTTVSVENKWLSTFFHHFDLC